MRLPNGYGSVYKLSGKRRKPYAARITIGWDDSGNRQLFRYLGYYRTKQEAVAALAAYNDNPYDLQLSKVTFVDIYKRWFEDNFDDTSNRSTVKNYRMAYKHCSDLYEMSMADIRPHHMQAVINKCSKGYQTQKRIHILFNQLYRWCMEHDAIRKNYAAFVKVEKKDNSKPRKAFTTAEIKVLWNNAEDNDYVKLVLMLIYSGVRISDLLNLRKEDVHLEEQWFYVRKSKTNSGTRIVPIADKVLPFWRRFNELSTCSYAVCSVSGQHMTYSNYNRNYWTPLMNSLNMQHTPHETRHTFISQAVMRNVNKTIIKKIVGHKSAMNITEAVYTHIEIQELINAVNMI